MKKVIVIATALLVSFSASAQLGKSLKDLGKSVSSAATTAATEAASDMVAGKAADKISAWMDSHNAIVAADSPYTTRLAKITSGISAEGQALNFKVYENPEANILSCANGSIRVYTGMMDMLTDDELQAVLYNEVGHIVGKDVRNNMLKVASQGQAESAASAQLNKLLSMSGEGLGTIVNELIQVPYTEAQSEAADKYAVTALKAAGKKADALSSALKKFAAMETADANLDENGTLSIANKYIKVNPNNAGRASLVK